MTNLEIKILDALKNERQRLKDYDVMLQEMHDEHMKIAEIQTSDYWKRDYEDRAKFDLSHQKHEYNFITEWKNVIASAMYGKIYYEWHSAQAGRYKGTGHGAYVTTELTDVEIEKVDKIFQNMINKKYFRISKSGKMAKFIG